MSLQHYAQLVYIYTFRCVYFRYIFVSVQQYFPNQHVLLNFWFCKNHLKGFLFFQFLEQKFVYKALVSLNLHILKALQYILNRFPIFNKCVAKLYRNSRGVNPAKTAFTIVCGLCKSDMRRRFFIGRNSFGYCSLKYKKIWS